MRVMLVVLKLDVVIYPCYVLFPNVTAPRGVHCMSCSPLKLLWYTNLGGLHHGDVYSTLSRPTGR